MALSASRSKNPASSLDQAGELRRIVEQHRQEGRVPTRLRTLAVLSGKGGVGKSNLAVNFACGLAEQGQKVVLLDADLGLANIDMLCGLHVKYSIADLIDGSRSLEDVLVEFGSNAWILPGGSGIKELADLDETHLSDLINGLGVLEDRADLLIVDTGAGIHKGVLAFANAADSTLLVTTPEPTSIRDAYGVLKALTVSAKAAESTDISLVVNMVHNENEGLEVANRIRLAASQFLGLSVGYLGCIPRDDCVGKAVLQRKPFYQLFPASLATAGVKKLIMSYMKTSGPGLENAVTPRGLKAFFFRLLRGHFVER